MPLDGKAAQRGEKQAKAETRYLPVASRTRRAARSSRPTKNLNLSEYVELALKDRFKKDGIK
jgi:hypothetical protein